MTNREINKLVASNLAAASFNTNAPENRAQEILSIYHEILEALTERDAEDRRAVEVPLE